MKKGLWINGEWKMTADWMEVQAPYSQEVIAQFTMATEQDVQEAIESAQAAAPQMAALTAFQRAEILEHLATLFAEHREEAASIISLESAKPLKYAYAEIDRTIETYKFAAEEAKRLTGEMIPMDASKNGEGRFAYTLREPIGVVAAITPFNFPQNLVAHKVGPALAAGNTIVLKPATQTALSAHFLAKLLAQTNLPAGAFNLVTGQGKLVGDMFLAHPHVKMITFTGSPAVGISLRNRAGLKKVTLELGSNAGVIIDEGVQLDRIMDRIVMGAFSNQGQVCISLQRIYVMESMIHEFLSLLKVKIEQLIMGDPLDSKTDLATMISRAEQQRAYQWIEEAVAEGAQIITGGRIENHILLPTVLYNAQPQSRVSCEEIFAPVVTVNTVSSIEDAIVAINDSHYGLQAGIFTPSIEIAFQATKSLQVGGVIINDVPTYRVDHMPYGGVKESGTGREGIKYAIEEMTEMKLVIWNNQ
ncbi:MULTISPECIES: aldehyde dehydrogenase family protein [unclassified Lysinibacillus]|uniref:aldehyde dehydrogenase family protein n=1 Tax=unclassified Lysinibacillus TaxID=2636778 RepID=UPI00087F71FA|nr:MULTISPECIES: aldehyde dehydrogenase family protein [unclassified Lysinibacillus]SCY30184.1 Acyl-CoA reductase [Lysinibacillus sp. SG9]SDB16479.1 Acyl-CoA reductase [Lysinibacillus sp. TC-37]SFS63025.1 Acyl-CoA reductase [Lysinibacillus sp. SG55]